MGNEFLYSKRDCNICSYFIDVCVRVCVCYYNLLKVYFLEVFCILNRIIDNYRDRYLLNVLYVRGFVLGIVKIYKEIRYVFFFFKVFL